MNGFFSMTVGIATIAGVAITSYQAGQSRTVSTIETVKINVENTIEGVISNLPQENRQGIEELLSPLLELLDANLKKEHGAIDKNDLVRAAEKLQKNISNISLMSYQADTSPFVPPINKVQFLCDENFSLAYSGQYHINSLTSKLKINSINVQITPGDIRKYETEDRILEITYLEYKKQMKGPILKYECRNQ